MGTDRQTGRPTECLIGRVARDKKERKKRESKGERRNKVAKTAKKDKHKLQASFFFHGPWMRPNSPACLKNRHLRNLTVVNIIIIKIGGFGYAFG